MDPVLIEKLWNHTNRTDEENVGRFEVMLAENHAMLASWPDHGLMPAILFLRQPAQALFMSFHHEHSNLFRHYHDFFELIYVCKGSPVGVINDQQIELKAGSLSIMNPNAVHYFARYSESSDLVLNIVLDKDIFQKTLFRILFNDPQLNAFFIRYRLENEKQPSFLHLEKLDEDLDQLISILVKEYLEQKLYSQVIIESLLTLLFSLILRSYAGSVSRRSVVAAEITDYIYMNYQTVTLEGLAEHFNYHPKYLSALLHRQTGQTFRSLISNIRLQNAVNYLLYSHATISQIVEAVGYKDPSSFYAAFRRAYGMSPAEYREKNRI